MENTEIVLPKKQKKAAPVKKVENKNLNTKLLEIMKVMECPAKKTENPFFSDKREGGKKAMYTDLKAVRDVIMSAMIECSTDEKSNHLLIKQVPEVKYVEQPQEDGVFITRQVVIVTTKVVDPESGEFEEFKLECIPVDNKIQTMGSAITYLRRYSLMAFFNIAPMDDDGNDANGNDANKGKYPKNEKPVTPAAQPPKPPTTGVQPVVPKKLTDEERAAQGLISEAEIKTINELCKLHNIPLPQWKAYLFAKYKVASGSQLSKEQANDVAFTLGTNPHEIINYSLSDDVVA